MKIYHIFCAEHQKRYTTKDPKKIGAYMQNFMGRRPKFAALPPNPEMQKNMAVYEIKPIKLRMLDNTIAPGNIDEYKIV